MQCSSPASCAVEIFTPADLVSLRAELTRSGLDSRHAAELIAAFLAERGYGVSSLEVGGAAARIESTRCTLKLMQEDWKRSLSSCS